ncbi:uncharacterized protein LOC124163974 [Ischnura elegans]|uniref:uncharacterized protein LOC124163974 n=1 Tax=Ischnura elegans TaxID=197161 RepID=UPI001ED8B2C0|nr:uncharacterized protein LOC124163974 [Ischnura elegans]XP_046397080.1 uncharacterized protein LOC124163974 [Ischnura elegans]XP_046397084.1 uncharacterized protein LOC124163974 [Ischnura elegans]XP_046397092.1 uncharacterized protein LOC124163974 [Ischnura elegans]
MFGVRSCDELRGYLDVKVPSSARKRGLLIQWKAWRRQWLVVRRFLVSSDPNLVNGEGTTILGRRLEVRLTGDSSPSNFSAPCPVVVVEEWQEDALVCPTQSRSHPYAFGLFPQPGCDPIIFLSGRSAEESRRWLASIRSLLLPPFRPTLYRISSHSNNSCDDAEMAHQQGSPSSSSPEFCKNSCLTSKYPHICFPPLPPLPSRCRFRRRSSVESLNVPSTLMDRRRSLSDSEITASGMEIHHRRRKCRQSIIALDPDLSRRESLLSDDYDSQHIYAGIPDSGVCSSMSNDSRSYLSSSSSSSCSSSSGMYAYATGSERGFKTFFRLSNSDCPANGSTGNGPSESKEEESSPLAGKVASSLITAGIGLMLSTPVSLDGVPDLSSLPSNGREGDGCGWKENEPFHHGVAMDTDRRESIASGIYEEIQDDHIPLNSSNPEDASQGNDGGNETEQLPPPLPPRSPSQFIPLYHGRQRNLARLLGVHRSSNSCPASDDEDDDGSRESSPSGFQSMTISRKLQRKISEPSGMKMNTEDTPLLSGGHTKRKNLESFLGVLEFGSRPKEASKSGASILNKSTGALDVNGKIKGEKDALESSQNSQMRGRTYTDSAGTRSNFFMFKEAKRCSSSDSMFHNNSNLLTSLPSPSWKNHDVPAVIINNDTTSLSKDIVSQSNVVTLESPEVSIERQNSFKADASLSSPPQMTECLSLNETPNTAACTERCNSLSSGSDKSFLSDKSESPENNMQLPKNPASISKRLPWMKPGSALMRLLSKEPNKQDSPSLRDRTRQAINRSLETLSRLSFSPTQPDSMSDEENLTVGASSFYRSATCTGVDMQVDRKKALRQMSGAISIDGDRCCRSYESPSLSRLVDSDRCSRSYETTTLGRRKVRKKIPPNSVSDDIWVRETDEKCGENFEDFMMSTRLLRDSAVCDYHKNCLQKSGEISGHTLEDIERLAKQEMICERFCMAKDSDEPDYIPMRPLNKKNNDNELDSSVLPSEQVEYAGRIYKRVSVVPEEDLYMSMDKASFPKQGEARESFEENDSSIKRENSSNHLMLPGDGDIYVSMEGRKSTLEELAQR